MVAVALPAQEIRPLLTRSATAADLTCYVRSGAGKDPAEPNERLSYYFHSSSKPPKVVLVPKDGYFFSAELYDAKSNTVAMTFYGWGRTRNFARQPSSILL
jgi:hypothetical protein